MSGRLREPSYTVGERILTRRWSTAPSVGSTSGACTCSPTRRARRAIADGGTRRSSSPGRHPRPRRRRPDHLGALRVRPRARTARRSRQLVAVYEAWAWRSRPGSSSGRAPAAARAEALWLDGDTERIPRASDRPSTSQFGGSRASAIGPLRGLAPPRGSGRVRPAEPGRSPPNSEAIGSGPRELWSARVAFRSSPDARGCRRRRGGAARPGRAAAGSVPGPQRRSSPAGCANAGATTSAARPTDELPAEPGRPHPARSRGARARRGRTSRRRDSRAACLAGRTVDHHVSSILRGSTSARAAGQHGRHAA